MLTMADSDRGEGAEWRGQGHTASRQLVTLQEIDVDKVASVSSLSPQRNGCSFSPTQKSIHRRLLETTSPSSLPLPELRAAGRWPRGTQGHPHRVWGMIMGFRGRMRQSWACQGYVCVSRFSDHLGVLWEEGRGSQQRQPLSLQDRSENSF